ncbi:MAG: hypothetical protein ACI88A_001889 [Paraglaciecola sp.]|jgi:hypothetical protein
MFRKAYLPAPNAYISVVIIIGDTSRVSNIYTKQVVQNTQLIFIKQLPSFFEMMK